MKFGIQAAVVAVFASGIAHAQQAVQWKVSDGGNGHWYQTVRSANIVQWAEAASAAMSRGGHLATANLPGENEFLRQTASDQGGWTGYFGPWLGGATEYAASECDPGAWRWITGEPWQPSLAAWCPGQPDCGGETYLHFWYCGGWNNAGANGDYGWGGVYTYLIEWDADCNHDGAVDYGQILSGSLADSNANGIPDVCESVAGSFDVIAVQPDAGVVTSEPVRAAISATGYPWRIRDRRSGIEFLLVPPGSFVMGSDPSDPEAQAEEMPAHQVTLTKPFYLGMTEVTQSQWLTMTGNSPSYFSGRPNNPVEHVSWLEAASAASAFRYRLPSEAEWEYACRGGVSASRYGILNAIAWWGCGFGGSSGWGTNPVATKLPNAYGFYDMIGNVWEYCQDFWGPYESGAVVDPVGPASGTDRVGRSGDWYWPAKGNRAPFRGPTAPDWRGLASSGIRYALSPEVTGLFDATRNADCNHDGIPDYGQCLDGTLADYNGNNIPDCCERGETCVVGNFPIQWKVSDGGNGHWYAYRRCTTGFDAEAAAAAMHGQLVSIGSRAENEFVRHLLAASGQQFAMIGFIQAANQPAPDAGWGWASGESITFTNWTDFDGGYGFSAPDDRPCARGTPAEDNECNQGLMYLDGRWDDIERGPSCAGFASASIAVIEWSADCNHDGIVDYGQILAGQLADANANGIPDACEVPSCNDADLFRDGVVSGADLGILVWQWGPANASTIGDINHDGVVDGFDLAILLANWGPCH